MAGQRLRNAAAMVALLYVGVQAFQEYVYRTLPTPSSPADELMAGASSLHVARSTLLLFAMFGLLFIFGVIALAGARRRPVLAGAAFLAYVVFFLLEIGLRSTELFWIQLQLRPRTPPRTTPRSSSRCRPSRPCRAPCTSRSGSRRCSAP
jgi:hypothetical protein